MSINTRQDSVTDFQGLQSLRSLSSKSSPEAIAKVAEQFEGIFLQMMLKNMRQASLGDGLLDNDQSKMYQELFDQQIALNMASKRQGGIANAMIRQLQGASASPKEPGSVLEAGSLLKYRPVTKQINESVPVQQKSQGVDEFGSPQDFVKTLWPLAERYAAKLGIAPEVMVAQAALETGWGRGVIRDVQGNSTHNLFNIKADERWGGDRASTSSLEFEGDIAVQKKSAFRSYPDYEASFADYVQFLQENPRYSKALTNAGDAPAFTRALQQAGYATDPGYANKINAILLRKEFGETVVKLKDAGAGPLS